MSGVFARKGLIIGAGICVALGAAVTVFILFRPTPNTQERADKQDKRWDKLPVATLISDPEAVQRAVAGFPVTNSELADSDLLRDLRYTVSQHLVMWGQDDAAGYLAAMRQSGEEPQPEKITALRSQMFKDSAATGTSVPAEPWELLATYFKMSPRKSYWTGIAGNDCEIRFFRSSSANTTDLGLHLRTDRGKVSSIAHWTQPPVDPQTCIRKSGALLFADVTVLIAHNDEAGNAVRPYVIRYWRDDESGYWRPLAMSAFMNPTETILPMIAF